MVTHNKLNIYCYYVLQNNAQNVCEQTDHTTHKHKAHCRRRHHHHYRQQNQQRTRPTLNANETETETDTRMPINFPTNRRHKNIRYT